MKFGWHSYQEFAAEIMQHHRLWHGFVIRLHIRYNFGHKLTDAT